MSTIVDKIKEISTIKSECRSAIMEKKNLTELEFPSSTPFKNYGDKLLTNVFGTLCELEELEITKNGEYKAKEGKAWSKIDINVALKTTTTEITENGEYEISDDAFIDDKGESYDAFSSVKVNVPTSGNSKLISKTVTDNDVEIDITDEEELVDGYSSITVAVNLRDSKEIKVNGSFTIEDEPYNERKETIPYGYSKIIVNQNITEKNLTIPSSPYKWSVTDETYTPITKDEDKIQGYSHIHLVSEPGEGPFTVRFMDDDTVLYTTMVYKGGSAGYSGNLPTKTGKYFCGWNPKPKNIQGDLDTKAVWADTKPTYRSWDEIVSDGNSVPIGTTMRLFVPGYSFLENYGVNITTTDETVIATKVYAGESGNSSTWVFQAPFSYGEIQSPHLNIPEESIMFDDTTDPEHLFKFCEFLNQKLSNLLQLRNEGLILRPALKLTETCILQQDQYVTRRLVSSAPLVWVVSANEAKTDNIQNCWMDSISGIRYKISNNLQGPYRYVSVVYNPNKSTENAALYPTLGPSNYSMRAAYIGFCTP